jgi:disulfide bond formation protein DsbB
MTQNSDTSQSSGAGCAAGLLLGFFGLLLAFLTTASPMQASTRLAVQPTDRNTATATIIPTEPPTNTPTLLPSPTFTLTPTFTLQPTLTLVPTSTPAQAAVNVSVGYDPELVARGEELFVLCAACHGIDGRGIQGLGKNLVESEFVASLTDEELLAFIQTGRPVWDAANTTGVDMPPRGGNPALTDEDIMAIIAYIRTLSAQASG